MLVCEFTKYLKAPSDEVKKSHSEYIKGIGNKGKIALAGRFADGGGSQIVWNVETLEEAEELAKSDPYSSEGCINYELRRWDITLDFYPGRKAT